MSFTAVNTNSQNILQAMEAYEEKEIEIAAEATSLGIKILCFLTTEYCKSQPMD